MRLSKPPILALTTLMAVGLTACSGSPSNADAQSAMQKFYEGTFDRKFSDKDKADLEKVKVLGCEKQSSGSFKCNVQLPEGGVTSHTFIKSDAGWSLIPG